MSTHVMFHTVIALEPEVHEGNSIAAGFSCSLLHHLKESLSSTQQSTNSKAPPHL